VDPILYFGFYRFLDGMSGSGGFGGGGGRDLESKVDRISGEETFFDGVGGFEDEGVDAIYYVIY